MGDNNLIQRLRLLDPVRNLWFAYSALSWHARGHPIPPPHTIKRKTVREYARQFSLDILIETGTYLGDMIRATKDFFREIYSIEIDPFLQRRAAIKFAKYQHVHIIGGDSGWMLPKLLSSISQPCLFWLDAHYSDGITSRGDTDTPVVQELRCILEYSRIGHVVLIDDARCFNGQDGYPALSEIQYLVSQYQSEWNVIVKDDIIRIHSAGSRQLNSTQSVFK